MVATMFFARWSAALALAASTLANAAPSLSDVLSKTANLSSLNDLLTNQMPGFLKMLEGYDGTNSITLLAPSDIAFGRIPYTDVLGQAFSDNDTAQINNIMLNHIIPGLHNSETLNQNSSFQFLPTMLTSNNWTNVTGGQRIGAVLQGNSPPTIVFTSGLSTRSVVAVQDVEFNGGVLHIVDAFAIPPMPYIYTADQYNLAYSEFSVLSFTGALYSQPSNLSLATLLNTTHDLTFFVPHNIAMELVSGSLTSLSPSALQRLLSYHVVPGRQNMGPIYSSNFTNGTRVPTLQGTNLTLGYTWNAYFVNGARVTASDILIANGVMHIIDNVLTPDLTTAQPNPTTFTQAPQLPTTMPSGEQFNSSAAPFTTWMPNIISTDVAEASATDGSSGAGAPGGFGANPTATGSRSGSSNSTSGGSSSGAESLTGFTHIGLTCLLAMVLGAGLICAL